MNTSITIFFIQLVLLIPATLAQQCSKFSYTGATGPANWGSLSPDYLNCSIGKHQSPINIIKQDLVINGNLQPLISDYTNPLNANLSNNCYNIGLRFEEGSGVIVVDGKNFTLEEMHWHTPSEHALDGFRFDAELHLVHMANDGSISVVAVLFLYGDPDPFLSEIMDKLQELAKNKAEGNEEAEIPVVGIDTKQIMDIKTMWYFRYNGSFTTPPCTETVIWNVIGKVRPISKKQVEALRAPLDSAYKNNNRPTQPLNGRKVELYYKH